MILANAGILVIAMGFVGGLRMVGWAGSLLAFLQGASGLLRERDVDVRIAAIAVVNDVGGLSGRMRVARPQRGRSFDYIAGKSAR